MADVKVAVQSQLDRVLEQIKQIDGSVNQLKESFGKMGEGAGESIEKQTKKTEGFLTKLRSVSGRVADQIRGDFKALVSVESITGALKISEQFKGSITETIKLSDTIRKLGQSFGIARGDFTKLQNDIISGMGEIGLSSESAANTIEGLAGTGIKGKGNILDYSKKSGELASISNQKGQEGAIARGMAEVLKARGVNLNSPKGGQEMGALAEDLRRAFNQTGKGPTELLSTMKTLFAGMSQDFRKTITSRGLINLAAAAQTAGPNSTKFLEDILGKSPIARSAFEAQGGKGIISDKGIDINKFKVFSKAILARVGGDPRLAAQTLGLSEDAAEGFIRLSESLDQVKEAQDNIAKSTGDLDTQYRESLGFGEAFKANINKFKGSLVGASSSVGDFVQDMAGKIGLGGAVGSARKYASVNGATDLLSGASHSAAGATAVVAGGGILAALLAGGGLRGIGKGLGIGGRAKAAAEEAITGEKVIPVRVVNADEIGGAGAAGGLGNAASAAGGMLGKAGKLVGGAGAAFSAGAAGYEIGEKLINPLIESKTQGTNSEGFSGNAVERMIFFLEKIANTENYQRFKKAQEVSIKLENRDLKPAKQSSRGGGF